MITAIMRISFQPHTSYEWAVEKITRIGLSEMPNGMNAHGPDGQFILMANLDGFNVLVGVSEERKLEVSRNLRLIPRVVKVEELDTRGA